MDPDWNVEIKGLFLLALSAVDSFHYYTVLSFVLCLKFVSLPFLLLERSLLFRRQQDSKISVKGMHVPTTKIQVQNLEMGFIAHFSLCRHILELRGTRPCAQILNPAYFSLRSLTNDLYLLFTLYTEF